MHYRVYHIRNFNCPLKVIENENYVNISINAFHYENVYVIDKSSSDIRHVVVKDNWILSNLPVPGIFTVFYFDTEMLSRNFDRK